MVEGSPAVAVSLVHVRSVLQEEFTDDQGALGKRAWGYSLSSMLLLLLSHFSRVRLCATP